MINVMIVDDHAMVRSGLRYLLQDEKDIEVIGEASTGQDAIKTARKLNPDVVLLDVNMPGLSGIEVTKRLVKRLPDCKILIISACTHDLISSRLILEGASGYLIKNSNPDELSNAIRTIVTDKPYLSPTIASQLALKDIKGSESNSPFDNLSSQELEIVLMIIQGMKPKDIADMLSLSPKTISSYHQKIYQKLGIKTDVEITLLAMRNGLLQVVEK